MVVFLNTCIWFWSNKQGKIGTRKITLILIILFSIFVGYLEKLTGALTKSFEGSSFKGGKQDFLKVITKPLTKLIVEVSYLMWACKVLPGNQIQNYNK